MLVYSNIGIVVGAAVCLMGAVLSLGPSIKLGFGLLIGGIIVVAISLWRL